MNITKFVEDTSEYIAGFVVKKILKLITCSFCQASPTINSNNCNSLISIKNRGGLIFPSNNVVKVCQETERIIKSHPVTYFNNVKNKIILYTFMFKNTYHKQQLLHVDLLSLTFNLCRLMNTV